MKRVLSLVIIFLCFCVTANAWEFKTTGSYSFDYFYISRTGPNDLFGNANGAQSSFGSGLTSIGLSGPFSNQVVVEGLSSKGADGSWTQEKLSVDTLIKANSAVSLNTRISFQGDLNGMYTAYPSWASPNHYDGTYRSTTRTEETKQAISSLFLNYAYGSMRLPLGTLFFGRKPIGFGPGWAGFHKEDTTFTGIGLIVPYGPFTFMVAQELGQTGGYNSPPDTRNVDLSLLTLVSSTDRNQQRDWSSLYSIDFVNGPLALGTLNKTVYYSNIHSWPQGGRTLRDDRNGSFASNFVNSFVTYQTQTGDTTQTIIYPVYGDVLFSTQVFYAKYDNGRFFFNGEYDQQYLSVRRMGGRPISGWPFGLFGETGIMCGPGKLTLAAFYRTGHDRQGGILDVVSTTGTNQQTATQVGDTWGLYTPYAGAGECVKPYSILMGYYGTGNNSYDNIGNPTFLDFKAFAGRVDYAAASNLNLFVSYLYARRASNTGSWWGEYNGGIGVAPTRGSNVPDNNLGWEIDAGVYWKLLENTLLSVKAGYWKPGNWFKFAYQDYSQNVMTTDPISDAAIYLNGNRSIDPIFGLNFGFEIQI